MSKYSDKYNMIQSRLKPDDEAVKKAVDAAYDMTRHSKRRRTASAPLITSRLAVAAAAILCVCVTVPVIAGIVVNEIDKRTRVEQYVDMHNVSSEYVQYPELSVKLYNADVKVDRYVRVDDSVIIDISMKNTNNKPGEIYGYDINFFVSLFDEDNGNPLEYHEGWTDYDKMAYLSLKQSEELEVYEISTEYNAETVSVQKSYLIRTPSDKLEIVPYAGSIHREEDIMVLDMSGAPVFNSENNGVSITLDEGDIQKCLEKTPVNDKYEYKVVPFKITISDFGIIRQVNTKEISESNEFKKELLRKGLSEDEGVRLVMPWTPARIIIEYTDGEKVMFANPVMKDYIPKSEKREIEFEKYNYTYGFSGYGFDKNEDRVLRQYCASKTPIDVSRIKSVYVDGIEFKIDKNN